MKKAWFIIIFIILLIIPIFHLYSQITFNDQIIISNSKIEGVNLGCNEKILWHQNQYFSQPDFISHIVDSDLGGLSAVYSADMDGDGDADLVGAAFSANEIVWWENLDVGSGSFYKHIIDGDFYQPDRIHTADLDGDGDMDVLGGSYQGSEVAWWENTDADTFAKHLIDGDFKRSVTILGVDLDSDGDIDVLGASKLDDDIIWWENDGSQNFSKKMVTSYFLSVGRVYATDVDNDGDNDVLGINSSQIAWWENDGTQNFAKHTIGQNLSFGYSVFAADLDSDGDVDVLGADRYGKEIAWWENDGSQNFTKDSLDAEIGWPSWLYTTDLDNDDDADILAVSYTDDYVCWYENLGSKSFDKHILEPNLNSAAVVHADDFDNDGDVDILGLGNKFYWWENGLITNPNPMAPDMLVEPDTLFFYVGPGERMETVISRNEGSSEHFYKTIVSQEQADSAKLTIKNMGNATLSVQNISCDANWIIDIDTTHFLLKPDEQQLVTIQCAPEDLFNGIYESTLTIDSNDPDTPVLDLPLMLDMQGGLDVNFVDEVEPNNRETEAQKVFPPSPAGINGSVSVTDVGNISIMGDDVEDLFVFTIQSNSLKIKLYDISADLDIFLMTISGNAMTIWGSNHRGGAVDEEYENTELEPGKYYVGVSIYDSYPIQDSSSYSLALVGDIITEIKNFDAATPKEFSLGQNYPNPFNPSTMIKYTLPKSKHIILKIYNLAGQEVATLVNEFQSAGQYKISWQPEGLPSGLYFYKLQAGEYSDAKKLILQK